VAPILREWAQLLLVEFPCLSQVVKHVTRPTPGNSRGRLVAAWTCRAWASADTKTSPTYWRRSRHPTSSEGCCVAASLLPSFGTARSTIGWRDEPAEIESDGAGEKRVHTKDPVNNQVGCLNAQPLRGPRTDTHVECPAISDVQ